jgi:WD40 repeat protein
MRFSADGKRCALWTNQNKYLTVLDAKDGRVIRRIEGAESGLLATVALSSDGKTVAAAQSRGTVCRVRVWDVASGVERAADMGHRAAITSLALSADKRTLISRDEDGRTVHWNLQTGTSEAHLNDAREESDRFTWSLDYTQKTLRGPRWRMVYKNDRPATIEVRSLQGNRLIGKTQVPGRVPIVALSPDGSRMAIAPWPFQSTVFLWNPEREEKPRELPINANHVTQLLFSHDGKRLIGRTGRFPTNFSEIVAWDTTTLRVEFKRSLRAISGRLLLTADDRFLLIGGMNNDTTVHVLYAESGKERAQLTDPARQDPGEQSGMYGEVSTALALSADERFLVVVSSRKGTYSMSLWETGSWQLVKTFAPTRSRIRPDAMVFSRDGRSLFSANDDTTILEWDISGRMASGRRKPVDKTLNKDRLNHLWQTLLDTPDKAYPAVWELLDRPAESVPFLIGKLPPIPPLGEKRVRELLAQLDSDSFAEREEANRKLLALGESGLSFLRQALKDRPSLEVRKRLEGAIESLNRPLSAEQLRQLRALAVLEWSGTAEASEHLRRLVGGAAGVPVTEAAKAALRRQKR